MGYLTVTTYINSGNVIFCTKEREVEILRKKIEQFILKDFGFDVPTHVISGDRLRLIEQVIPPDWANDDEWKTDVCFLWEEIDEISIVEKLGFNESIENMMYAPGAVIWHISRENQMKSKMQKVIGTKIYTQMTIRNVNTVRKLGALLV